MISGENKFVIVFNFDASQEREREKDRDREEREKESERETERDCINNIFFKYFYVTLIHLILLDHKYLLFYENNIDSSEEMSGQE